MIVVVFVVYFTPRRFRRLRRRGGLILRRRGDLLRRRGNLILRRRGDLILRRLRGLRILRGLRRLGTRFYPLFYLAHLVDVLVEIRVHYLD